MSQSAESGNHTDPTARTSTGEVRAGHQVADWTDLGREMWSFLTGREAAIDYRFVDMTVEVPRDTGPQAARATWKLNGTLRITTTDNDRPHDGRTAAEAHA